MKAGKLRTKFEVHTPTTVGYDAFGTAIRVFAFEQFAWGDVQEHIKGGGEYQQGAQTKARANLVVEVRFIPDLDESKKFIFNFRTLNIESIDKKRDQREVTQLVKCIEDTQPKSWLSYGGSWLSYSGSEGLVYQ